MPPADKTVSTYFLPADFTVNFVRDHANSLHEA